MKYQKIDTPIHRISPFAKIVYSIAVSLLVVLLKAPLQLCLLAAVTFCVLLLAKPDFARLKGLIYALGAVVITTSLSQAFFYYLEPRTVLVTIIDKATPIVGTITGGIYIYKEGALYGLIQSLRISSVMFMATAVVISTHPSQMIMALNKIRIPKELSFIIATSMRFLPQLLEETRRVLVAIRLKGFKLKGISNSIKASKYVLSPLVINSLRQARLVALAAEVRGYSFRKANSREKGGLLRFDTLDLIVISFFVVLLYVAILPFKMGLSKVPLVHAFFFSIPFTCVLLIGIRIVPRFGTATLMILGHSLFAQIVSRGINPLWWPYALLEAAVLETYFFAAKDYLASRQSFFIAGLLRGLSVYLYFYFVASPYIWHKFYAPWYIVVHTFEGALGSAVGGLIAYRVSKSVEAAYRHGGL
ncbi:MAG: energy-coupling factor transporter transmembrane protein EcfT [Candidatus Omnitrophica bacterium]|nr:energy-coupling factor transporter transmembrane protein EcfT [Candidatus Omnitrophota bacterium]MCM8790898.1 energy-coupling factor transporter transmembrane protein EcfT [Candidatus Omnitrophota bacterium]